LYSFEARGDCVAIDEPLYREWLINKGDTVARPYGQNLIDGISPDGKNETCWRRELLTLNERISEAAKKSNGSGVIFCKHMAKHSFLYDFDKECKVEGVNLVHQHLLLIRDPVAVLSSWGKSGGVHGNNPSSDEVGIVPVLAIFSKLENRHPRAVLLESDELVTNPEGTIANLCFDLSIVYRECMLSWPSGSHKCDGPWAKVSQLLLYFPSRSLPEKFYLQ
jgi:hypothetical protein